jgi:Outer membrane protein beta-barrel domain
MARTVHVRRSMRYVLLLALSTASAFAQVDLATRLAVGFKAGSPINDTDYGREPGSFYSQSRWTGGPTIELQLPLHLSVEFDALYRAYNQTRSRTFRIDQNTNPILNQTQQRTAAWDLPVLLKYRFRLGEIRPFVSAGYLFTHERTDGTTFVQCQGPSGSCTPPEYPAVIDRIYPLGGSGFRKGPTAGLGVEFRTGFLTIAPELRWSRYLDGYPRENRFVGLVGFTFGGRR